VDFDAVSFMDRKLAARTDRFAQMALASAKLALEDASAWDALNDEPERVGLILGSGIGGVTSMETTQATIDSKGPARVNPFSVTKIMPNSGAAHVAIQLGVQGPSITGALACTCGTDMMALGFDLIRRGDADVVLCGATEASITPVIVAGFIAMRAMSRRNDDPEGACRPYDSNHNGFLIGEGAAVMVLESAESVERRGAEPYAKITGVGRSTDAHNLTDPDPKGRGIMRAMQLAVESSGLEGKRIGYINPHGTGTVAGDGPESQAMAAINPGAKGLRHKVYAGPLTGRERRHRDRRLRPRDKGEDHPPHEEPHQGCRRLRPPRLRSGRAARGARPRGSPLRQPRGRWPQRSGSSGEGLRS
jgi:3-oxoacyl-[acyl-carrier-protein] synthase II